MRRSEIGKLPDGSEYTLVHDRWENEFPHMKGNRGGRAMGWFLTIDGDYVGGFDRKRDALPQLYP